MWCALSTDQSFVVRSSASAPTPLRIYWFLEYFMSPNSITIQQLLYCELSEWTNGTHICTTHMPQQQCYFQSGFIAHIPLFLLRMPMMDEKKELLNPHRSAIFCAPFDGDSKTLLSAIFNRHYCQQLSHINLIFRTTPPRSVKRSSVNPTMPCYVIDCFFFFSDELLEVRSDGRSTVLPASHAKEARDITQTAAWR